MLKSYVIEYGSYILAGMLASIMQHWLELSVFQFWAVAFASMAYYASLPYIRHISWGKDN